MSTTRYEAATLYDSNRRKTGHPPRYLVLDLDTGSAGACSCDKDGRASLTATWALPEKINLWTAWVECIQALLGEDYPFDVASELQRQLPESNRALHNYLTSDRLLDSTALTFGERSLTCSQVEASFETVGATLDTLLQQGEALVPERAQETMGIFPLGQAAHCFLVEHAICTHFSADPFLPDDRFVLDGFTQDSAQVIAQGMALASQYGDRPHRHPGAHPGAGRKDSGDSPADQGCTAHPGNAGSLCGSHLHRQRTAHRPQGGRCPSDCEAALRHGAHGQRPDRPGRRRGRQWGDLEHPVQSNAHAGVCSAVDVRGL